MRQLKKLPIGIQSIKKILQDEEYVYVDKTPFAYQLINSGAPHHFLSRPRRFGKSLFVSTLKEIFKGNKELFEGQFIYESDYDWEEHPVLHFDFAQIESRSHQAFELSIGEAIEDVAAEYDVSVTGSDNKRKLNRLIKNLSKKNRVVILVDEYDHPIINNLKNLDIAEKNRESLKGFFEIFKTLDDKIRFTFITGVSKFSQVSIFSGLNNLSDITMELEYAAITGYTEEELSENFESHIMAVVEKRFEEESVVTKEDVINEIRIWYNGYRFSESKVRVYNPFSTLRYLMSQKPESYWYATGTPSFLVEELKKHPSSIVPLSGIIASKTALSDISDLEKIKIPALMFQTGYLTITEYEEAALLYSLAFPNKEVKEAFIESLTENFTEINTEQALGFCRALENHDFDLFFSNIERLIAGFPYQLFTNANEATYHGVFFALLKGMSLSVRGEEPTNLGRIDLVVKSSKSTFIIELKLDKSGKEALEQIIDTKYHQAYLHCGKDVVCIGINFHSELHNISDWEGVIYSESGDTLEKLSSKSIKTAPKKHKKRG